MGGELAKKHSGAQMGEESGTVSARRGRVRAAALDGFDRRILAALQRDGRLKLAELSAEVGLSATPARADILNV